MPLVRISLLKGKPASYLRAISQSVHRGLVDAYRIPPDDLFHIFEQRERDEFLYDPGYLGIHRTDDLVYIHIIAGNWRDTLQKQALFKAIADHLHDSPGLRREDVFIALTSNERDEWSLGNGVASYVKP